MRSVHQLVSICASNLLVIGALLTALPSPAGAQGQQSQSGVQSLDGAIPASNSTVNTLQLKFVQEHTDEDVYTSTQRKDANKTDPKSVDGTQKSFVDDPNEQPEEQKVQSKTKPYHLVDLGYCLPDGRYSWQTKAGPRMGVVPNPTYAQRDGEAPGQFADSGYPGMVDQLMALIPDEAKGTPISNAEFATLAAAQAEAVAERVNDPTERVYQARAEALAKQSDAANNAAECAEGNGDASLQIMTEYLINVANENAAQATSSQAPMKTYGNVIWMVQQMYKQCYIPMAILFLLPGAVITQAKSLISFGTLGSRDEDTSTPFPGIVRGTIAIFLIPATQLFVSYTIDVGNSVTYCVTEELNKNGGIEAIIKWAHEQTYDTLAQQNKNFLPNVPPVSSNPQDGKISGRPEQQAVWEQMTNLSATMQMWFNTFNQVVAQGLAILNGFQTVMICYLFLLGPVAAALYAWPSGVGRDLFKKVFASWLDGVVILSLWKFWWNICLLCMAIRLSSGIVSNPTDQYELFMYTAFMGILMFVPFNPFEFRPGEVVSHVLEKAQQQAGKAAQSGAGAGTGPAGGGGAGTGSAGPGGSGGPVGARHKGE